MGKAEKDTERARKEENKAIKQYNRAITQTLMSDTNGIRVAESLWEPGIKTFYQG